MNLWAAADLLTPMAIRVAATLRLADHLTAGTRTTTALATAVDADPGALQRLLNHLVTAQVLTRDDDLYSLTPLGDQLRADHPSNARAWLDLTGAIGHAELSFIHLLHTVRTGEPAYPQLYGTPFWDDLTADPARAASFDALMASRLSTDAPAIAAAYPWSGLGHLIDVGGGNATLLIAILQAHPTLRGTVLDLQGPAARAAQAIAAANLTDRAGTHPGSFFDPLPAGAGGYLLSGVLHDWDDPHGTHILHRCATAAAPAGTVLVLEDGTGIEPPNTTGDLRMLCYLQGQDRTHTHLIALAHEAGLTHTGTTTIAERSLLSFQPA
ncbi:methyltransferase [Winogradskya humida]|uniref:Methyltransferase n=1 Tax=Winogradskya humida TaxID=113566 RepID=A0ABQ3ZHA6_9ACTN|nr:methyltransferase [Actinoplanes humidus]GIE17976.1 methyltransferase [Actinoplanes humidus]